MKYMIYIYICMTWMNDCRVRVWKYEVRREFMTDKWRDTCDTPQRRPEKTAEINDIADATRTVLEETEEWSCVYMGSNSVWRHENTCDITRGRPDKTAENDSKMQQGLNSRRQEPGRDIHEIWSVSKRMRAASGHETSVSKRVRVHLGTKRTVRW